MLDRRLVEDVAARLGTDAGLVEKDWHVVRALGVLARLDHGDMTLAFSGGTSLSKGWHLIKRFSEDIDFKVAMQPSESRSRDRNRCKAYRNQVLAALAAADFEIIDDALKGNEDRFFSADFAFKSLFGPGKGLRPHLRVEMSFLTSALPPASLPIRSLVEEARGQAPEIAAFLCVDPVETAADKLSALAWRVCTRQRGSADDDPTIVRHLHDLAALENRVAPSDVFPQLVHAAMTADIGRGDGIPFEPAKRFRLMLQRLEDEEFWADEYEEYTQQVSFAPPSEQIHFSSALAASRRLIERVG